MHGFHSISKMMKIANNSILLVCSSNSRWYIIGPHKLYNVSKNDKISQSRFREISVFLRKFSDGWWAMIRSWPAVSLGVFSSNVVRERKTDGFLYLNDEEFFVISCQGTWEKWDFRSFCFISRVQFHLQQNGFHRCNQNFRIYNILRARPFNRNNKESSPKMGKFVSCKPI